MGGVMRVKRGVATEPLGPFQKHVVKFEGRVVDAPSNAMLEIDTCPDCHARLNEAMRLEVLKIRGGGNPS